MHDREGVRWTDEQQAATWRLNCWVMGALAALLLIGWAAS